MIAPVLAAMSQMELGVTKDLVVILVAAALVALVMQRARMAVIPAYLLTGALIGPQALGFVPAPEGLGVIAHLAIILLLFGIGLELHLSALKHRAVQVTLVGCGAVVVCTSVGWVVGLLFGLSAPVALAVAMAMALSSTAVVLRVLAQRRELHRIVGRLAFATLVIQDLAVLGMLGLLPLLARWAHGGPDPATGVGWEPFIIKAVLRLAGVTALAVFGRLVFPRLIRESTRARSPEVLMIVGVAMATATALATQALGFSLEMGAFLAGFLLAGTHFRYQLGAQIGPLRDVSIAVFFTTVGMKLDPQIVIRFWWTILLSLSLVVSLKAVLIGLSCWACGATGRTGLGVGICLAQAGEFSLLLLGVAHDRGLLSDTVIAVGISIVILSLVLTPTLIGAHRTIAQVAGALGPAPWIRGPLIDPPAAAASDSDQGNAHVIVAGYGPMGRRTVERLETAGLPYTVVELNAQTVADQAAQGKPFLFGDIASPAVLESAGVHEASALVLTVPDEEAVLRACTAARHRRPELFIAARMNSAIRSEAASRAGATYVLVDELAAAEAMVDAVVSKITGGRPSGSAS